MNEFNMKKISLSIFITIEELIAESGLQYYRARYFDNDMGRFISRDPIG